MIKFVKELLGVAMKDDACNIKIQVAKKLAKNKKYTVALNSIQDILLENFATVKPAHMRTIVEALLEEEIPRSTFKQYYYRHLRPLIDKKSKIQQNQNVEKSEQKMDTIASDNENQEGTTQDETDKIIEDYKDAIDDLLLARELEKKMNKEDL